MRAETVSIVNDLKKVTVNQVVFEAITNSIQADATKIQVRLDSLNDDFDKSDIQLVSEISIIDNGHGFEEDDLESFQTYRSRLKKHLGAKGIGRFLYLKLFERVSIHSLEKLIDFTVEEDVKISDASYCSKDTILRLTIPRDRYQVNKESLCNSIKIHFLPMFKLLNTKPQSAVVTIEIVFGGVIFKSIKSSDIPDFKESSFRVGDHEFKLGYLLNHDEYKGGEGAYCADGRVVALNSNMDSAKRFRAFKGIDFFYLLSSEYFDKTLNDERDEFSINAKRKSTRDMFGSLSWDDIHLSLGEKIRDICIENGINISEKADKYLAKAVDQAPYLSAYFDGNEHLLPDADLLKIAQKRFNEDKEKVRADSSNLSDSDRKILLNRVVQAELAEYVFDRQKTIDRLKSLEEENALEKEIHNLFIERNMAGEGGDFRTSNLWLFDDRFMSYDKIFSDKQIKEIFPELSRHLDRPDILTISSNTYDKDEITDIVIIELKRPEAKNDVAVAESELLKYSRYARLSGFSNIRIWTYAFISFDEEASLALDDKSYNIIPVRNGWPIRYCYHSAPNTIINFIDYKSLAFDAEARNNTFLDILKAKHYGAKKTEVINVAQ